MVDVSEILVFPMELTSLVEAVGKAMLGTGKAVAVTTEEENIASIPIDLVCIETVSDCCVSKYVVDNFDSSGETIIDSLELVVFNTLVGECVDSVDELRCVSTGVIVELMISVTATEVVNDILACISHSTTLVVVLRSEE